MADLQGSGSSHVGTMLVAELLDKANPAGRGHQLSANTDAAALYCIWHSAAYDTLHQHGGIPGEIFISLLETSSSLSPFPGESSGSLGNKDHER